VSFRYINWVTQQPSDRTPSQQVVLLVLADMANDEGFAWPGVNTLAARTKLHVRTIQRAVVGLVHRGDVAEVRRQAGPRGTNVYRLRDVPKAETQSCRRTAARQRAGRGVAERPCIPGAAPPDPSSNRHLIPFGNTQNDIENVSFGGGSGPVPTAAETERYLARFLRVRR
jgi:hypothetical protein